MFDALEALLRKVPQLDVPLIYDGLTLYRSKTKPLGGYDLRKKCLRILPELRFGSDMEKTDLSAIYTDNHLLHRRDFVLNNFEAIKELELWCAGKFPEAEFIVRHRIASVEDMVHKERANGQRAWFDIVGFQIVPRSISALSHTLKTLNEQTKWEKLFVFNTFPFVRNDFKRLIGPESAPYYRALHYYLKVENVCVEIQVRTPMIDQWSMLHHAACYKPTVSIVSGEVSMVMMLGQVANWVDCHRLCDAY